ncbi:purine-nucleoside phosphorylase [Alkalicoccus luteus]|uniref:Purine nucleoside phosphorylase n=1 Tax=Alkalicoccus luteus TaxID=1237094 RepID=A0A969PR07_9BACI|nr:purine-nucleoside phosphorylase [Alkalicoccus luteus]NJP38831.1 purine-nucleoside phosphorylase [Alkalicoccus luteus]
MTQITEAAAYINEKLGRLKPETGLILGSGLGVLAEEIENPVAIPYQDIPGFPASTVAGHKGQLVAGKLEGRDVVAMQGRFHFYEGYPMELVTLPVRAMYAAGVKELIVTNAAGGINESFDAGNLMLIEDHLNMFGTNPLIGENIETQGPRFPDMSKPYNPDMIRLAAEAASEHGIEVKRGVYAGTTGPSYETPAEVRMLRILGADAVGMSTVPEVITAGHCGLRVLGISCISNMAAGILDQPLTHDEVMETTEAVKQDFIQLVKAVVNKLNG